jgi:hypothetical protein
LVLKCSDLLSILDQQMLRVLAFKPPLAQLSLQLGDSLGTLGMEFTCPGQIISRPGNLTLKSFHLALKASSGALEASVSPVWLLIYHGLQVRDQLVFSPQGKLAIG